MVTCSSLLIDGGGLTHLPEHNVQYLGTWATLVNNAGFDPEEAKTTEKRYLTMFKQSYDWLDEKIDEVCKRGYATLAFGLRLRAPVLHKTVIGSSYTPKAAAAERRSVGNALSGQSYGLLNSRLGFKLQEEVLNSEYRHDIKPCAQNHDANYLLVRDSVSRICWLNNRMRKYAQWQELPELIDPDIILDGELELFYPSWANGITIKPMDVKPDELREICSVALTKYKG